MPRVVFNKSGTHVQDGRLKVRLDVYSQPGETAYEKFHSYTPVLQPYTGPVDADGMPLSLTDYQTWRGNLPFAWRLNPHLGILVQVDPAINKQRLREWIGDILNADVLATIDEAVMGQDSLHIIDTLMRERTKLSKATVVGFDEADKTELNNTLNGFFVDKQRGVVDNLPHGSIDVGWDCDTNSTTTSPNTRVVTRNPANADGTITSIKVWHAGDMTATEFATFYGSLPTLSTRAYEYYGDLSGSTEETLVGFTIAIQTGDYIGMYWTAGSYLVAEFDAGGPLTNYYYYAGDKIPCTSETFSAGSNYYTLAIEGTGVEGGAAAVYMHHYTKNIRAG